MKRKIIIDCDPGIDDALALIYAIANEDFDILAVHTVAGNVNVDYTTTNTQGVLGMMNVHHIPICKGSNVPLVVEPVFADDVHGANGMGGYEFSQRSLAPLSNRTAVESYLEILENSAEKITIVAIGPLTNVAILLRAYPHVADKIEQIAIMGGGIKGGNVSATGEFNFFVDPHAAHVVINSGLPIILAGLDVTEEARLFEEDLQEMERHSTSLGSFMLQTNSNSIEVYDRLGFGRSCTPNDVVPFMYLIHPEIFEIIDLKLNVSYSNDETRGMTYTDMRIRTPIEPNARVIMDVNRSEFRKKFKEAVIVYSEKSHDELLGNRRK